MAKSAGAGKNLEKARAQSWGERAIALLLVVNLALVLFNLSYLPWRDYYLQHVPQLVRLYDRVRGVRPHPDTERYLNAVTRLEQQLAAGQALAAAPVAASLADLRQQSQNLAVENPFLIAHRVRTYAKFKWTLRRHLGVDSTRQALQEFWSADYLARVGWRPALAFFDTRLRPLLASNFYRELDRRGRFVDYFWQLDLVFMVIFALDFLVRTWRLSRTRSHLNWGTAILQRWYDGLLLLPTGRWLRAIPTVARLHQTKLLDLEQLIVQATREPAAHLAERTTSFLLVRLVNQTKTAFESGKAFQALLEPSPDYRRVGAADKVDAILNRLLELAAIRVLPQVQPELQALLRYNLRESLQQSELYQGLHQIPGIQALPAEVVEQLADYLAEATCQGLGDSYQDPDNRALVDRFLDDFRAALRQELADAKTQAELQQWIAEILEEIKLNYLQQAAQPDPETTLAEADALQLQAPSGDGAAR